MSQIKYFENSDENKIITVLLFKYRMFKLFINKKKNIKKH